MTESVIPQGVPHLQFLTSKLKNSATTSALFAGFAMIALVEVDIKGGEPQLLTIIFATLTSLLIFFHLIALLISTCLIPTAEGLESFIQPEHFSIPTNSMKETFIKLTRSYINTAWLFTTVLGTFFFMAEIIVLAWLKFYLVSLAACYAITAIIVPMMLVSVYIASKVYKAIVAAELSYTQQVINNAERYISNLHEEAINGDLNKMELRVPLDIVYE